jgi:lipoprotein-releasing system ATP-binding protein
MPTLTIENLRKEYPTPTEPLVVLDQVSLQVQGGENLAIVGPSGSGKSTLLQIAGTLDTPTAGSVRLDDVDPFSLNEKQLAQFRNRNVGFIFQDHHLLPQLSAIENVLVPTLANGPSTTDDIRRAKDLLARVGLADRATHRPAELSGGERQRVAIARSLIYDPTLLLADEPTGNLDQANATSIANLLIDIQAKGESSMILIVVTHSLELANRLGRCFVLSDGKLLEATAQR